MVEHEMMVKTICFKTLRELFGLDNDFNIIAGPCAIESKEQMESVAKILKKNAVVFLRGGAYKPRTSPYDFQGLGLDGLKILDDVRKCYNLLTVTEILDPRDVELGMRYTDIIQIGSRNMQNYSLLKEVGKSNHPVLLKRGMMATLQEFLYAAEYLAYEGNERIILCERGIRTFENGIRNMLDIAGIATIKNETSLSVIADLSHSLGRKDIIKLVAKCLVPLCNGIMVEIHPDPKNALSDSQQQLNFDEFTDVVNVIQMVLDRNK
ncbi:MAG: 3-deoxy-7-phosphoheptulonate synthase [Candidatus Margulisbacteria bacterium GWF2_35_9]|nr:MAG: 3-deoxy-7-phosphoheptulonate synthase [Candidatus Margulisbacteria bacterium GWF2_35_9]